MRKKNGFPLGASGYSTSDLIALLDTIEAILLVMDFKWQLVESYFSENYAEKYEQSMRNDVGLKMKFRSLCRVYIYIFFIAKRISFLNQHYSALIAHIFQHSFHLCSSSCTRQLTLLFVKRSRRRIIKKAFFVFFN
jgi:hypothetical protein